MAKISRSFESKLITALDSKTGKLLAQLEDMSACAGLKNDSDNVFKARINHYGGTFVTRHVSLRDVGAKGTRRHIKSVVETRQIRIPERHFIDVPLEKETWLMRQFEKEVANILSGGKTRTYLTVKKTRLNDSSSSLTSSGGAYRTLYRIAQALAKAQQNAVYAATPPNAESTVKRKGFDAPLRDTYEMVDSIKGWVEK